MTSFIAHSCVQIIYLQHFDGLNRVSLKALLYFAEHIDEFGGILHCLLVVQDASAFFLVLVVLLVLFYLTDDASEHQFAIQDDHACLLEVFGARDYDSFVCFDRPQQALVLL